MVDTGPRAETFSLPHPWLVISDLDGTILDHWDYSATHMMPLLEKLEAGGVPVVFNTSKTAAELMSLRQQLNNRHPFIVENGGAIYLPRDYFPHAIPDAQPDGDYQYIVLGTAVAQLRHWLNETRRQLALNLVTFSELSVREVATLAGLNEESAAQAQQREFSEVIVWNGSMAERATFCRAAAAAGLTTRQGGRFLHLLGTSDKGQASLRLLEEFEITFRRRPSLIVCGDGDNDVDMLQRADLALLVRSPNHELPALVEPQGHVLTTRKTGPEGLAQLLRELLT